MSSVVKTNTAFTDGDLLIQAIISTGIEAKFDPNRNIITNRVDYFGPEKFVLENGRYVFVYDSFADHMSNYLGRSNYKKWLPIAEWLTKVDAEYRRLRKMKMDALSNEQRIRAEKEMRKIVESRRDEIIKKAKNEGYAVKEVEEDGKIRLVLTRTTY